MFSNLFETLLIKFHWLFVILFLIPLSIIYSVYESLKNKLSFFKENSYKAHDLKIKEIQDQIKRRNQTDPKKRMCTGRPGWKAMSFRSGLYKNQLWNVDLSKLTSIFHIDREKKLVFVEPLVNMKQLTSMLNPLGLTVPVLPELDDLTVGGLIMGMGIESQSYRYGLFQHCCEYFDIILASGELVRCSKEENSELFYSVPGSYGTLGFLVAVAIRIIPAKKYVKVQYLPLQNLDDLEKILMHETQKDSDLDFIEAIVYSPHKAVIIKGKMEDECKPERKNSIGYFWKPWFYKHVEKKLDSNESLEEYIPIQDYYHRYSRGIFWEMNDIIPFGNHPFFRYLLGWSLPIKISLIKRAQIPTLKKLYEKHHILQDMIVPISDLKQSLLFFDHKIAVYPIWLCPVQLPNLPGMLNLKENKSRMYVDIGVYGNVHLPSYQALETIREIEKFVRERTGFQMLYADCYMNQEEFQEMFDHTLYKKMRALYECENAFPEVYDKINIHARS
ncbi:MAG: FAD-binding oxidoreductase [Parachlamydiaceae bacterium]|nr:FAD-binding oxidoreductase [Parachlamydiaceae bacterium]